MRNSNEQIEMVLKGLDLQKIETALNSINHVWSGLGRTPNQEELKRVARHTLTEVSNNPEESPFRMGGFEAANVGGALSIKFILDRSEPLASLLGR